MEATVESTLANSLWVLLHGEFQQQLGEAFTQFTDYRKRVNIVARALSTEEMEIWSDEAYVNVGAGNSVWKWQTFPHPSSWPKKHHAVQAYMTLHYTELDRTYVPGKLYMSRPVELKGKTKFVMIPSAYAYLLVYADLMCSTALAGGGSGSVRQLKQLIATAGQISTEETLLSMKELESVMRQVKKLADVGRRTRGLV